MKSSKKRISSKKVIVITLLSLISLFVFITASFHMYILLFSNPHKSLSEEIQEKYIIKRENVWSTLIVVQSSVDLRISGVWYVVQNDKTGMSMVYYVPPGVYMKEYSGSVNEYVSTSDLRYVGDIVSPERDLEYAIWQLNNLTGITVDEYIWIDPQALNAFGSLFGDISEFSKEEYIEKYSNPSEISLPAMTINSIADRFSIIKMLFHPKDVKELFSSLDSNSSTLGVIGRLQKINKGLSAGDVYMLDLTSANSTYEAFSSSGRSISLINYSEVDKKLERQINILKGRAIEKEQVKVEVYNASGIEGLASRYYRKLRNAGLEVVRYENAPNMLEKTTIFVPNPTKYKYSLELSKAILVVPTEEVNDRPSFMTTGDIVILLGKDMNVEAIWK